MNRREFLVGAAAVAGLPKVMAAGKPSGLKFGFCAWDENMRTIGKQVGFDFFEWAVEPALGPEQDAEWWRRQKDLIAAAPLPLRSCNGYLPGKFRLTGPNADHEPALKYAEIALRRAAEVGVKTIVFGSGGARNVPGDFCGERNAWPDLEKGARQYADFCRELCRRTEDLGDKVSVVIEPLRPNESNIVNFVWQGVQICQDVDSPRLRQLADLFHMMMGREDAESIVKAGPLLKHCHIAEFETRLYPGANPKLNVRLAPYFKALKDIGYEGGISCECGWGNGKEMEKKFAVALKTMKELASK